MCLVLKQTIDVVVALVSAAKVYVLSYGGFLYLQGVNERFWKQCPLLKHQILNSQHSITSQKNGSSEYHNTCLDYHHKPLAPYFVIIFRRVFHYNSVRSDERTVVSSCSLLILENEVCYPLLQVDRVHD